MTVQKNDETPLPRIANVLSIAGSDPSGGAGIQADLKVFSALGVYGMAALTALTAQNTQGVASVELLDPAFVARQVETVFADIRVDAVKIGMLANADIVGAVAAVLAGHREVPVILDPVMVAKGGAALLDDKAVGALVGQLLPRVRLITPNLPEAAALLRVAEAVDRSGMEAQAKALLALGAKAVLLKGGHLPGDQSPDLLVTPTLTLWLEGKRIATANTHGTGCSLSSAIAAELAKAEDSGSMDSATDDALAKAVTVAKAWLAGAVRSAGQLTVGSGHGPVHHFYEIWPK
ncbi:bifunctional hydroxymethylpyrimidine kinase/phosphomethylpyrimidine kinase [Agrobacterium vitis]|uniref:bifunctional hydroxymethylpyrimidine kinase/phosphomethylpyrimidine kinase n=1 Tax=Agrobacterium vitis TaxID=373 RepID=UPI0008725B60|nr:bifunctional hydroxymethylpyrimidine kinase/phosphomethylpyrimidine kinase [Agrobacterium vitis]MCE6075230.1 bifunctional hydroxymethylpyrimidine kinase/phosphomethylpyrimidine kinase [Agrobacterium vitis]MCM2449101.1 bifunctional hydroxymethylpyrimidine kinase/phosphomethylpyrimidine kinase [Agrobacterium vitis]MCM2467363.1 bifunctional hydroxymethylpyrimidine kinase/phosphomethylpyrimidine kinase [Agrobacterium vitis]MUO68732.1 bifunctional hydroxymethylpyrimidine kinase/phosphomethylpyrim